MISRPTFLATCASLFCAITAAAAGPPGQIPTADTMQGAAQRFLIALAQGNREVALEVLDERVTIFENGRAELSREEYAREHLAKDSEFLQSTKHSHLGHEVMDFGDHGVFLTRYRQTGERDGKAFAVLGATTMVLERTADGWRIVHIHWSSVREG